MADWQRVIGALRRLRGSDLAERAGRIAEAAPDADRQFTQPAMLEALQSPHVGVGPGSAYNTYHPLDLTGTNRWAPLPGMSAVGDDSARVDNLRSILARGRGFNEVPWMDYLVEGDPLHARLRGQEGRHRSMAIGDDPTLVGLRGYQWPSASSPSRFQDLMTPSSDLDRYVPTTDELTRMPVQPMSISSDRWDQLPTFGQSYRLFDRGGAVRRFIEGSV